MNTTKFSARTVSEALRQVRQALGSDAVILGETRRNGWVEITASSDMPVPRTAAAPRRNGVSAAFAQRLRDLGFDTPFVDAVAANCDPLGEWQAVERQVVAQIGAVPRAVTLPRGRVRLIGPPGAGKTTSVIRLAANHVLHHGTGNLAIITTDTNRLAGSEALLLASELLRVPVIEARDAATLKTALAETADKALVIIDTPGLVAVHRLPETIGDLPGFETFVVMPATFQANILRRLLDLAAPLVPSGVLLSHVDAVDTLGEVLSVCRLAQLPIVWIGAGTEMADGLESATAALLGDYATRSLAGLDDGADAKASVGSIKETV